MSEVYGKPEGWMDGPMDTKRIAYIRKLASENDYFLEDSDLVESRHILVLCDLAERTLRAEAERDEAVKALKPFAKAVDCAEMAHGPMGRPMLMTSKHEVQMRSYPLASDFAFAEAVLATHKEE